MSQNAKTRATVEATIIRKAWADEEFKKRLMAEPTATYSAESKEAGAPLPEGTEVRAIEEGSKTLYLVIPNMTIDPSVEVKLDDRSTRSDFEAALVMRALRDANFKKQLMDDPKTAYEAQLASVREAATLPEDLTIQALAESDKVLYFRLPQPPIQGGELSEEELEEVAGGVVAVGVAIVSTVAVGLVIGAVLAYQDQPTLSPTMERTLE
jgi:hypothetical protein